MMEEAEQGIGADGLKTEGGGARLRISGMGLQGRDRNATRQQSAEMTGVDGGGGEGHRAAISQ